MQNNFGTNNNTPDTTQNRVIYAGFWIRVLAFLVDSILWGLIMIIPWIIIGFIFGSEMINEVPENFDSMSQAQQEIWAEERMAGSIFGTFGIVYLILYLVPYVGFAYQTAGAKQATWGKRTLKLKVILQDASGAIAKPDFKTCLGRYIIYPILSIILSVALPLLNPDASGIAGLLVAILPIIWYGMAGWTREKTAVHDMIFHTRVIRA